VRRIAAAAPRSLVLLDQAYIEYADEDIDPAVLDLANVVVVRTMSKAWVSRDAAWVTPSGVRT